MIKVYTGLSLDRRSALKILPDSRIMPPIIRGDLIKDIDNGVNIVVIIDGRFHQDLAVTPDEIMDALSCGIKVYGASSMGALRASELYPFGMIGHGLIYEHIVATPNFRDDFVAQVYSEDDDMIVKLSLNYIDLYMNLLELKKQKMLTAKDSYALLKLYSNIYYSERSWTALRYLLCQNHRHDVRLLKVAEEACTRMGSQKHRDAISVLRRVRTDLKSIQTLQKKYLFNDV
jgi:hypothetical protein